MSFVLRPLSRGLRLQITVAAGLSVLAIAAICESAHAQSPSQPLPPVTVEAPKQKASPKKAAPTAVSAAPAPAPVQPAAVDPAATPPGGSLTVPTTTQAEAILARVPGSVVVVPDTAYKYTTPALTIKDVLDYVPGVFAQPKWG